MDPSTKQKLEELRSDYEIVNGRPFSHFYCPILFRDEDVGLCQGHIVNRAFPGSSRAWIVQREDVDNFFGSIFEGAFVDVQPAEKVAPDQVMIDAELSKKLRPAICIGGRVVEHFVAVGPVPNHFAEVVLGGPSGTVRLGLKMHPDEASAALGNGCQILIDRDLRLPALVSVLKAAHLTLFRMLGYRYALSAGGIFLGWTVLGDFFLRNKSRGRAEVLANAASHFRDFANMARPVLSAPTEVQGTVSDHFLLVCRYGDTPWAMIVFVRTSDQLHAALVPVLDEPSSADRFVKFLRGEGGPIQANRCRFEGEKFLGAKESETFIWPEGRFEG